MDKKIKAALEVYKLKGGEEPTDAQLKALGFEGRPTKEYLNEAVKDTLAAAYVEEHKDD